MGSAGMCNLRIPEGVRTLTHAIHNWNINLTYFLVGWCVALYVLYLAVAPAVALREAPANFDHTCALNFACMLRTRLIPQLPFCGFAAPHNGRYCLL